ncbi:hypothetical protein SDC9_15024 [bioreactor metagenome]|uniref:Uncharacterized protein n=1 Tax=bioreactor metagenome TaxID=1076179 RepID=A0A644TS33_9ZZZZ
MIDKSVVEERIDQILGNGALLKNPIYDDADRRFGQLMQLISLKTKDADLVASLEHSSADMVYECLTMAYELGFNDAKGTC